MFFPVKRGTLLILSGPAEHIYFICNDPVFYPRFSKKTFLAVNLTSVNNKCEMDPTCIVNAGEHQFVKHQSYILYQRAAIFGSDTITEKVISGDIRAHQPCEESLFLRILSGFETSPNTSPKIKRYYQKYCRI